jgi:hypothetical protein
MACPYISADVHWLVVSQESGYTLVECTCRKRFMLLRYVHCLFPASLLVLTYAWIPYYYFRAFQLWFGRLNDATVIVLSFSNSAWNLYCYDEVHITFTEWMPMTAEMLPHYSYYVSLRMNNLFWSHSWWNIYSQFSSSCWYVEMYICSLTGSLKAFLLLAFECTDYDIQLILLLIKHLSCTLQILILHTGRKL